MSAIAARAFAPTPLLRPSLLRLRLAAEATGRVLLGLLPQGEPLARDAALALELRLLGRTAR